MLLCSTFLCGSNWGVKAVYLPQTVCIVYAPCAHHAPVPTSCFCPLYTRVIPLAKMDNHGADQLHRGMGIVEQPYGQGHFQVVWAHDFVGPNSNRCLTYGPVHRITYSHRPCASMGLSKHGDPI